MPDTLSIADLLSPTTVRVGLEGADKPTVLGALIDLLDGHDEVGDLDRVRQDVFAREAKLSTGVGLGLGLPHARTTDVRRTVAAFATTAGPVPFESHDSEPVRLLFLLVGPEGERGHHVKLLGRISRLMNRPAFRDALLAAVSPSEVLDLFREAEAELAV
ncbi:MAG: PTS sugar transporter subunit IIA [Bacteroidota bacterium]